MSQTERLRQELKRMRSELRLLREWCEECLSRHHPDEQHEQKFENVCNCGAPIPSKKVVRRGRYTHREDLFECHECRSKREVEATRHEEIVRRVAEHIQSLIDKANGVPAQLTAEAIASAIGVSVKDARSAAITLWRRQVIEA